MENELFHANAKSSELSKTLSKLSQFKQMIMNTLEVQERDGKVRLKAFDSTDAYSTTG
jgi:hypothetical protein